MNLAHSTIDTHFHVFDAGRAMPGARYVPAYGASLPMWQAASKALGVGRGVLVQPSFLGTDNRRLVQELSSHPDILRGVAVVGPNVSKPELLQLHACGVRGIRLNLAGRSHDPGDWPAAHAQWETMASLNWHIELHTDSGALPQVLAWLPVGLTLVLDHMGKPGQVAAHDHSVQAAVSRARLQPVYVKLSGAYRLEGRNAQSLARLWWSELGADRLLWGSDWPCTNHEKEANYPQLLLVLQDWVDRPTQQRVLVDNPGRLYDFA